MSTVAHDSSALQSVEPFPGFTIAEISHSLRDRPGVWRDRCRVIHRCAAARLAPALEICPAERLHRKLRSWVARQDNIPRGRTIPMGAVPVLARGLWHTAPTYLRRRPGSPSNGRLGSALILLTDRRHALTSTDADPKAVLRREALARRGALAPETRVRLQPSGCRRGPAPRAPLDALGRLRLSSDPRRAGHAGASRRAGGRGLRDRPSGRRRPRVASHLPALAARRSDRAGRDGAFPSRSTTAPAVDPDLLFVPLACFDRRGHRIGYGAGYYDRSLARLTGDRRRFTRSASPMGFAKSPRCLMRRMTRAWTPS